VTLYPGAKKWFLGNIAAMQGFEEEAKSDTVVGPMHLWMLQNIHKFADKKEDIPEWSPVIASQQLNNIWLFIADGGILNYIETNKLAVKDSMMKDHLWDKRLKDNLFSLDACSEQV